MYVWLANFVDELQRIRPHVTLKLANVIGRQEYAPTRDPKEAAAAYHACQEPSDHRRRPRQADNVPLARHGRAVSFSIH
jgi:hypothetical protein